jgi:TolA-binding protein
VTALAAADYDEVATPAEHRVVLRAGRLTIDGGAAPDRAVVVVASNAALRATGARFAADGSRGALRTVRVFAGSVEITQGPTAVVIAAGESWTFEPPPPVVTAPAAAAPASHFATGWAHLRGERFADAARELALATAEPGVGEDAAYWSAVAWARAGEPARARAGFEAFLDSHAGSPRAGEAHLALARLHLDDGARDRARPHLEAAAADPDPRVRAAADRLR